MSSVFGAKLRIFRNLWCVRMDKEEGGHFFAILYRRVLWTAPNKKS